MKSETILNKVYKLLSDKQKNRFYLILFCLFIGMILEAFGIGIILPVLNIIVSPESLKQNALVNELFIFLNFTDNQQIIIFSLSLLIGVYLFKSIYLVGLSFYQNKYISLISSDISNRLFKNYLNQDFMFHKTRNSSELIKAFQVEINLFIRLLQSGLVLITEVALTVAIIVTLFFVEPYGTIFIIIFFLIFGSIYYLFSKHKSAAWGVIREKVDNKIAKLISDAINGFNDVYILGKQNFFQKKLINYNKIKARVVSNQVTLGQIPRYYLEFISIVSLGGFILIMILNNKNINEIISTGGVFIVSTFRVLPSVNRIIGSLQQIKFYRSSVEIVYKDLKLNSLLVKDKFTQEEILFKDKLSLSQITFCYPKANSNVFENLDFTLNRGEVVGIIGPSGIGKSTLTNILVGFLHDFSGEFKVDGLTINLSNSNQWRKQLGYVSQSIYLIDDSIQANIAFGEDVHEINKDRMENAIKKAQLQTFIQSLPNQLDTIVGERGAELSGGQQQRIGIARALYHDPNLLILDEATSALDHDTESDVLKAVESLKGEITILIITHRLSTLDCCDKIYKVENKKLIAETNNRDRIRH